MREGHTLMLFDDHGRLHGTGISSNVQNPPTTAVERADGTREHWQKGRLHRDHGPAVEFRGDVLELDFGFGRLALTGPVDLWFQDGQLSASDRPAVTDAQGSEIWLEAGRVHRSEGPAVTHHEEGDTLEWWFSGGVHHRVGGPALVADVIELEWSAPEADLVLTGRVELWLEDGRLHREGGPAVTDTAGRERCYRHGRLHREDGPAMVNPPGQPAGEGERDKEWFIDGSPAAPPD